MAPDERVAEATDERDTDGDRTASDDAGAVGETGAAEESVDPVVVAGGVVAVMGLTGVAVTAWLARERGVRPRLRAPDADRPV